MHKYVFGFNMAKETDYELLSVLYSRKMTRSNFQRIRNEFKRQTGKDLCDHVTFAKKDMIRKINDMLPSQKADKLRTDLFKLIDYSIIGGFCVRKEEKMK